MPKFDWLPKHLKERKPCLRSVFTELESANVKNLRGEQITGDQACQHCQNNECKVSKFALTFEEQISGKSVAEIQKDRKRELEAEWKRRKRESCL